MRAQPTISSAGHLNPSANAGCITLLLFFPVDIPPPILNNPPSAMVRSPKWRNWQTRRIQNPVGLTPGEGSIPSFGNAPKSLWDPQ
jgi:hypothetical protein